MKDTAEIMEGDVEWDIEAHFIEICGLDFNEYFESYETTLNREIFEKNLDKILDSFEPDTYVEYLILGYFILKTGAEVPKSLINKIAEISKPENDTYKWANEDYKKERVIYLNDLHKKILNHKPGQITRLLEEGGGHPPKILLSKKKIETLIEKGCLLERTIELLDEDHPEKITREILSENLIWHCPLNTAEDASLEEIYEERRHFFLQPIIAALFNEGIDTPEKVREMFISVENPEGIPLDELIDLVKTSFKRTFSIDVDTWEDAVEYLNKKRQKSFPTEKDLKWWKRIQSYIKKNKPLNLRQIIDDGIIKDLSYEELGRKILNFWILRDYIGLEDKEEDEELKTIMLRLLNDFS